MKIISKNHFTLLEMLIAMTLTALILSTLTYFYRQVDLIGREIDRAQEQNFALRYVEGRLAKILPKITSRKKKEKNSFFFSGADLPLFRPGTENLLFTFDHCVHLDKEFSNIVLGRLYITPEGEFCLGLWPFPKNWVEYEIPPMKKEILMSRVDKLQFEFFSPPNQESVNGVEPGWTKTWRQEYKILPALIRITVHQEGADEPIHFAFPLPKASQPITYRELL